MHIYLHIPFCKQACHYCDFHFSTNTTYKERMVKAIAKELELQSNYLQSKKLKTIYFGGGTPSLLTAQELELLFNKLQSTYDLSELQEVTIEANPDDINPEILQDWHTFGINRVSLGIQTFNDVFLKLMNRSHSSKEAIKSLELILNKGFATSTADLIYSKTGVHLDEKRQAEIVKNDIQLLNSFGLKHISAYNLTIESKTVFGKWTESNKLAEIPENYAADQFCLVVEELTKLGFEQYEISNFAKGKSYAIHNTSYWMGEEYLGVGPSAHSFNGESRQWNVANNHNYMRGIEEGKLEFEKEILSINDKVNDYLMTGLRTIWGVSLNKISQISAEIPTEFRDTLEQLIKQNLIVKDKNHIIIPEKSRILSDRIASDLFWT